MTKRPILCPAGTVCGSGVICGAIEATNDGAHVDGFGDRGRVSALMDARADAGIVANFCGGGAVPDGSKAPLASVGDQASYTACRIWRAEKERIWARRRQDQHGLHDVAHRDRGRDPEERLAEIAEMTAAA